MTHPMLNRREFLRLSLIAAGSALASACQPTRAALMPTPTRGPSLKSGIQLNGNNADAWTFIKSVRGSMANPAACQAVWVDNDETRKQATLQENFFSAEVPIRSGANSLKAVCQHTNQEEELSSEITINGRLQQRPTAVITPSLAQGLVILDGGSSLPDEVESKPIREFIWSAGPGNPAVVKVQASAEQEQQEFRSEISGARIEIEPAME